MLTQCLQAAGTKHDESGHAEERNLDFVGFKMENLTCIICMVQTSVEKSKH
jgi:hypothetical protein